MLPTKGILVLVAMEVEARAILKKLQLERVQPGIDPDLPLVAYASAPAGPVNVSLVHSGKCPRFHVDRIGKEAATLMAWESIRVFRPNLIISAGTAGGFRKKGARIGDVYAGKLVCYHDRPFQPAHEFVDYGIGRFSSFNADQVAGKLGIKTGNVSTGNALVASPRELAEMEKNNAELKDMEAAAIAEVAHLKHVPMLTLKTVTDFIDEEASPSEQFLANYKVALGNLSEKLALLIQELAQLEEVGRGNDD